MSASLAQLIESFNAGRPVIITDDEGRENEGDLIIPADLITPDIITFMAKKASGLICLAIDKEIADRLELELIGKRNNTHFDTAFLTPVEAKQGVTTGISAADRAHTIKVVANPKSSVADIATPGHMFPVLAHEGGLQARQGHTEAGIYLAQATGCSNAAVICEIMNEDGTMARGHDLEIFAKRWDLQMASIESLMRDMHKNEAA